MARDKLITIRIEGEKREAFNNLAKSQNTDTASLLYDFISGCLDGRIDIKLVTGKGNRLDNQLDTNRLDKLETATQKIDERVGQISKKLNDWVEAFDDRLNALAIQWDSQRLDKIDTDSQYRQREKPDIEPVATVEIADNVETAIEKVEAVTEIDESVDEPDNGAIESVPGDSPQPKNQLSEAVGIGAWYTIDELLDCRYSGWPKTKEGLRKKALTECWPRRTRRGSPGKPYEYQAVLTN